MERVKDREIISQRCEQFGRRDVNTLKAYNNPILKKLIPLSEYLYYIINSACSLNANSAIDLPGSKAQS